MIKQFLLVMVIALSIGIAAFFLKPYLINDTITLKSIAISLERTAIHEIVSNGNTSGSVLTSHSRFGTLFVTANTSSIVQGHGFHVLARIDTAKTVIPKDTTTLPNGAVIIMTPRSISFGEKTTTMLNETGLAAQKVEIADRMKIRLQNEGPNAFTIEPKTNDIQPLLAQTIFDWYVTPLDYGAQTMLLNVSPSDQSFQDQLIPINLTVSKTFPYIFSLWVDKYFEIFASVFGTLIVTGLAAWVRTIIKKIKQRKIGFNVNPE